MWPLNSAISQHSKNKMSGSVARSASHGVVLFRVGVCVARSQVRAISRTNSANGTACRKRPLASGWEIVPGAVARCVCARHRAVQLCTIDIGDRLTGLISGLTAPAAWRYSPRSAAPHLCLNLAPLDRRAGCTVPAAMMRQFRCGNTTKTTTISGAHLSCGA